MKKFEIIFSEIIRYNPILITARSYEEAVTKFTATSNTTYLEKTVGIRNVVTEEFTVKEI